MTVDYELFGEDEDFEEILSLIRFDDFDEATNVKDELSYNSGWYNYSQLTFDYKGKRYTVEYKEHTSDNVSDMEYLMNSFACLGKLSELEVVNEDGSVSAATIAVEEYELMKAHYERRIAAMETERKEMVNQKLKLESELRSQNEVLGKLSILSAKGLKHIETIFKSGKENEPEDSVMYKAYGAVEDFFGKLSELKK